MFMLLKQNHFFVDQHNEQFFTRIVAPPKVHNFVIHYIVSVLKVLEENVLSNHNYFYYFGISKTFVFHKRLNFQYRIMLYR